MDPDPDDGFPAAFDRYAPAILRYARRRLAGQDAAWDVVSDTFTSAWRHWERRPPTAELSYLRTPVSGAALVPRFKESRGLPRIRVTGEALANTGASSSLKV